MIGPAYARKLWRIITFPCGAFPLGKGRWAEARGPATHLFRKFGSFGKGAILGAHGNLLLCPQGFPAHPQSWGAEVRVRGGVGWYSRPSEEHATSRGK
jgi:hypothetical protein